ncbi:9714_t:CDS:2 [Entrophospora sp. SA101]|nr:9714_t:CDS:2 [Entrophospora sp. SA101]
MDKWRVWPPDLHIYKLYVTENATEADAFYMPFFGSCYLFNCWTNNHWNQNLRCNVDDNYVSPFMNHIINDYKFWNKSSGRNHFLIHPMDHQDDYYERKYLFQSAIYLTTIGDKRSVKSSEFRRNRNVVIPSATAILNSFKINPLDFINEDGNPNNRNTLVIFRGCCSNVKPNDYYSEGVRHLIFNGLNNLSGWDIGEGVNNDEYAKQLAGSKYGLAPSGWTLDTTRIWEYLAFGVVPIVIADGIIEPFEDDVDWDEFIVRVRRKDAHRLNEIITNIPDSEYKRKQEIVWKIGKTLTLGPFTWHYIARK